MTYVRGVPEGHPQDKRIALFVTNKGCSRAYFTYVLLYVYNLGSAAGRCGGGGRARKRPYSTREKALFLSLRRRPLRRCRAGMSSLVYSSREDTGGRLAVGFRHVYMDIALQVGETRLHNNAPGPISSLRLNRATTTIRRLRRRRNAIVARLAAHAHTHTHTQTRARARLHEHTTHERALHATRTGTGGGPTHYWRARTLYDDGNDATATVTKHEYSENYYDILRWK